VLQHEQQEQPTNAVCNRLSRRRPRTRPKRRNATEAEAVYQPTARKAKISAKKDPEKAQREVRGGSKAEILACQERPAVKAPGASVKNRARRGARCNGSGGERHIITKTEGPSARSAEADTRAWQSSLAHDPWIHGVRPDTSRRKT
jgi:hypothetical protein